MGQFKSKLNPLDQLANAGPANIANLKYDPDEKMVESVQEAWGRIICISGSASALVSFKCIHFEKKFGQNCSGICWLSCKKDL